MKQLLLLLALLTPLFFLLFKLFVTGVDDPIKYIYMITGGTALTLLFATTTISLLHRRINLIRYRRTVGLFSFFYVVLHMSNFIVLDMELDLMMALQETLDKPFIYLGMSAFIILLFMAATSQGSLFPQYFKYHKVIYIALLLASIHFAMGQKVISLEQWGYLSIMMMIGVLKLLQRSKLVKF